MATAERVFAANHPAASGHFPGNPIIPGALLLSETLHAIEESLAVNLSRAQILSAKFLHPARPGDRVSMEFAANAAGTITFACTVGAATVLTGKVAGGAVCKPA